MREKYFSHLIHEFYGSLAKGGNRWAMTARGILILITDELLAQV